MSNDYFMKPTLHINGIPFEHASLGMIAKLHRELERSSEKFDKMIESKDRVDISLKKYEELKRVNKDLLDRLNHAEGILGVIGIPADMIQCINRDSVKVYSAESFDQGPLIRKCRYRIEFDVEE